MYVVFDVVNVKSRVDESFNWVFDRIMGGGDIYGVIIGFGVIFYCCM